MAPAQGWHEQILGATLKLFLNGYGCTVFRDVFFVVNMRASFVCVVFVRGVSVISRTSVIGSYLDRKMIAALISPWNSYKGLP